MAVVFLVLFLLYCRRRDFLQLLTNRSIKMKTTNIERKIRTFVRAQFAARVAHNGEQLGQCIVHKNSARVLISNPKSVYANMVASLGKPTINKHTAIFRVAKRGTVALTVRG